MKSLKTAFLIGLVFFILGVITLPHYGVNWDTINHLPRGQAYLRYFLTGKKDYSDLPLFFNDYREKSQWYWQNPESLLIDTDIPREKVPTRSLYQIDGADYYYLMEIDGNGHPPLSDILSAAFNRVLFGRLRIVNDIDSYRIYGVLLAAATVGLVFYWASESYGVFAGLIASLALALYPLYWAESHFNTEKDIPVTAYISFMLFSFWKGLSQKNPKWILLSGVFFGLALGTKFNVLFAAFIVLPYLVYFILKNYGVKMPSLRKDILPKLKLILAFVFAPLTGLAIFVGTWPYLWADPLTRIQKTISFYKEIGLGGAIEARFIGPFGITTYPVQWIAFTTPLVILFFGALGLFFAFYRSFKEKKDTTSFLFLLWFLVPIIRVTWPGTSVYGGGSRQIMEFIPALALLAGLGASSLKKFLEKTRLSKNLLGVLILLLFSPITLKIMQIHPNENVYFNPLIGGLSGAKEKNFPYWGFSFGAPYRQGINYINKVSEKGASVVYAFELIPNIPKIFVRGDLNLHNGARSGYLRRGEYAITLIYQGISERSYYDKYLEKFVEPVYEVKVDGVAILKVWKNDEAHLKDKREEEKVQASVAVSDMGLRFDLGEVRELSRLEIKYKDAICTTLVNGYVLVSEDLKNLKRMPGDLPDDWRISALGEQPKDGNFVEPFLGEKARYVDLVLRPLDTCLKNVESFQVYAFR